VDVTQGKVELRKRLRHALGGVAPEHWRMAAADTSRRLLDLITAAQAKAVLFYMPTAKELDIGPAAQECLARGVAVHLPRANWSVRSSEPTATDSAAPDAITPALITAWDRGQLVETRHGIFEPPSSAPAVDLARLDLVIVPGLAFDARGGRLGKGGGFYDRFLGQPGFVAAKVGVGLDEQVVEEVPRDSWDVALDALVTPTRTLVFSPRPRG
jgi:5-formyltetrahydrofolate cyclo-ligase